MGRLFAAWALAAFCLAGLARAQEAYEAPLPERTEQVSLPLDPAVVETFIDGVVEAYRREKGIAGVTVSVVARDGVLMQKGYGFAALKPERPVDPDKTLFRVASISKTFTYVMAMQLVAEGKLKLDAPADDYLPDALKFAGDGFPVPKLLDLMQHTAGFEDSAIGHLFSRQKLAPLEEYLTKYRPKRVRPPGAASIYSNYSVGLLGLIIARVDGRPFEDCVEARILKPLGIVGLVTFREPPEDAAAGTWASAGFKRDGGWFDPQAFFYVGQVGPAGAAHATASGIARYMRMLLNGGTLDGATILDPKTFALMVSDSFSNAPEANAVAHGFLTARFGGLRSFGHDGAAVFFYSSMVIWPEAGLAIFVSENTDSGYSLTANLPRLFIEHFVPTARAPEPKPIDMPATLKADLAGPYVVERRNMSTFEGFLQRMVDMTSVAVKDDGSVIVANANGASRYVLESTDVLRAVESNGRVRVKRAESGAIALANSGGVNEARKLGIFDSPLLFNAVIGALLATSVWCVAAFLVRLRYRAGRGQGFGERASSAVQLITALLWLAAATTLLVAVLPYAGDDAAALFDYPGPLVPTAQMLLHAAAIGSIVTFVMVGPAWRGPSWRLRRLTFTVYALLAVGGALLLWRWGALLTPVMLGA